jgi:hypothetical protein
MALEDPAIEFKIERFIAVNQTSTDPVYLTHLFRPAANAMSRASSTLVIL